MGINILERYLGFANHMAEQVESPGCGMNHLHVEDLGITVPVFRAHQNVRDMLGYLQVCFHICYFALVEFCLNRLERTAKA